MSNSNSSKTRFWKRGDAVQIGKYNRDMVGIVLRVAWTGEWADVWWMQADGPRWTKRQPDASLLRRASKDQCLLATVVIGLMELERDGFIGSMPA